jgi:hypothetical protein
MRDSLQPDRLDRTKFLTIAISYRRTDSAPLRFIGGFVWNTVETMFSLILRASP